MGNFMRVFSIRNRQPQQLHIRGLPAHHVVPSCRAVERAGGAWKTIMMIYDTLDIGIRSHFCKSCWSRIRNHHNWVAKSVDVQHIFIKLFWFFLHTCWTGTYFLWDGRMWVWFPCEKNMSLGFQLGEAMAKGTGQSLNVYKFCCCVGMMKPDILLQYLMGQSTNWHKILSMKIMKCGGLLLQRRGLYHHFNFTSLLLNTYEDLWRKGWLLYIILSYCPLYWLLAKGGMTISWQFFVHDTFGCFRKWW